MKNNAIWFDGGKFGFITGLTMLIGTLGAVFSEAPSLFILGYVSWRQAFLGVGAVTLVLAVLIFCLWRAPPPKAAETPETRKTIHPPPGGTWPSIVSNKQLDLIMLAISGTNGTFYAFSGLWGTHLFTRAMSISVLDASMIITVALLIYGFSSLFFGKISDQLQTRKLFIWVSAFLNTLAWLCLMLIPSPGLYTAYLCFALIGLSSGVQVVVCFAAVKESVPANITGSAIAYVNMGVFLVTAIIQSLYGWLVSHLLSLSLSTDAAYIGGLSLAVIISLLGLLSSLGVRETYPRT
jgi:MFS family permease